MSNEFMDQFLAANPSARLFTDISEAAEFLGIPGPPTGPVYDKSIPKLLEKCLAKAGTPAKWRTLRKHTLVNGRSLPVSETPPDTCWWELGHHFEKLDGRIFWNGLTVDCGEHCDNHTAWIYPDGKIMGTINCFRLGEINIDAPYVKDHLEAWLGRIPEGQSNYWDAIDGKPVEKTAPVEESKPGEKAESIGKTEEDEWIEEGDQVENVEPVKKKKANKKKTTNKRK